MIDPKLERISGRGRGAAPNHPFPLLPDLGKIKSPEGKKMITGSLTGTKNNKKKKRGLYFW